MPTGYVHLLFMVCSIPICSLARWGLFSFFLVVVGVVVEWFHCDFFCALRKGVAVRVACNDSYFGVRILRFVVVEVVHYEIAVLLAYEVVARSHGVFAVVASGEGILSP